MPATCRLGSENMKAMNVQKIRITPAILFALVGLGLALVALGIACNAVVVALGWPIWSTVGIFVGVAGVIVRFAR